MDEQEVELRDYIKVLVKWKMLIIGLIILAILVSGILVFLYYPLYMKRLEAFL